MKRLTALLFCLILVSSYAHQTVQAQSAYTAQDLYAYGRYFLTENLDDAEAIKDADLKVFAIAMFADDCDKANALKSKDLSLILKGVCSGITFPKEFEQIQDPDWKRLIGLMYFWEPEFMEGYKSPQMTALAKALYYRDTKMLAEILKVK